MLQIAASNIEHIYEAKDVNATGLRVGAVDCMIQHNLSSELFITEADGLLSFQEESTPLRTSNHMQV